MAIEETVCVVVTDANVIINFIHIERLDLLSTLPGMRFVVPEHVVAEITDPVQKKALETALDNGHLEQVAITEIEEMENYTELHQMLGQGEAACLAIAKHRGYLVSSDEKRAFRRLALERIGRNQLLTTPDLIVHAIRAELTTVIEADQWKEKLQNNRFAMKFRSFSDLL